MDSRDTLPPEPDEAATDRSALPFTLCLFFAYGTFVALNAFAPGLIERNLSSTHLLPLGLVLGLLVILLGIIMTLVYVVRANNAESRGERIGRFGAQL